MFDKYNIKTTFFIPGHSLETFPEECKMVAEKGHEIGLHGYSHENPKMMTLEQQRAVLDRSYKLLTEFCGKVSKCIHSKFSALTYVPNSKPPRGSVVPWWETPKEGAELMMEYGESLKLLLGTFHDYNAHQYRSGV